MDEEKKAQLMAALQKIKDNNSVSPNFGQFLQEKGQGVWDQGGANLQHKADLEDRMVAGLKSGKMDREASRELANDQVGQMAMGSLSPMALEAGAAKAVMPAAEMSLSEKIQAAAMKSEPYSGQYMKGGMQNMRLRKLMEEQARARDAALSPMNNLDKTKIIVE